MCELTLTVGQPLDDHETNTIHAKNNSYVISKLAPQPMYLCKVLNSYEPGSQSRVSRFPVICFDSWQKSSLQLPPLSSKVRSNDQVVACRTFNQKLASSRPRHNPYIPSRGVGGVEKRLAT